MTKLTEALMAARTSLMRLYDEHLPSWDDAEGRLAFISAVEETFEALDRALTAATTPKALGCVIPESEDGVALRNA